MRVLRELTVGEEGGHGTAEHNDGHREERKEDKCNRRIRVGDH